LFVVDRIYGKAMVAALAPRLERNPAMVTLKEQEILETAETLIEDRGHANALVWVEHCLIRSNDGFWRAVRDAIQESSK
jgi:hypothetical protein